MSLRRTIKISCLAVFLATSFAPPRTASAAPPMLVQETEAQLVATGCEPVKLADDKAMQAAAALDWQAVVASDATGEALVFCPSGVASVLQPLGAGQVAGLRENLKTINMTDLVMLLNLPVGIPNVTTKLLTGKGPVELAASKVSEAAAGVVAGLLTMIAGVAIYLIDKIAPFIPVLLTQADFVGSAMVKNAWPVVLGVANGGFLLALVFIALLTALRLDVGGGVKRLLPRLLIAALLVNFSLVIAGFILDVSRLVMALITSMLGFENLQALAGTLVISASTWETILALQMNIGAAGWEVATGALIQLIVAWVTLAAVVIVVVGLLVRYVALIALIIVSPLAYLFIALPGAGGLAKRWWTAFMRYVIYGPVVLMLLIVAVKATSMFQDFEQLFDYSSKEGRVLAPLFNTAIFTTFVIFAAMAGRYAGILGSATAIGIAVGAGRRARGMAYGGAKGIAKGVAAPVTVPARGLAKGIGKGARDYIGAQTKGFLGAAGARVMARFGYGPKDKPPGKKFGERVFGKPLTPQQGREAAAARSFTPSGTNNTQRAASIHGSKAWSPSLLRQDHVGGELTETQRRFIMDNPKVDRAYKVALAGNAEAFKKMTAQERDNIEKLDVNLDVNLPTTGVGGATVTANRAQNQRNAIQNETNRAVQRAYYQMLDRLIRQGQAPPTP